MSKLLPKFDHEGGFVSLLTAVMLSLLLLAITVSLISLQVLTLRKAEDNEQSQVAYYAAESGVEDAIAKVKSGWVGSAGQNCPTAASSRLDLAPSPATVGWSCQFISLSGAQADILKQPDTAVTIDPYNAIGGGFTGITLLWDQAPGNPASYFNWPGNFDGGSAAWDGHALPLEVTIVSYPAGSFTSSQLNTQNALFVPTTTGAGTLPYTTRSTYTKGSVGRCGNANIGGTSATCGIDTGNPYNAKCGGNYTDPSGLTTGLYHCQMKITGLSSVKNYMFRVQSRFLGDNGTGNGRFVVVFTNGGVPVNVNNTTATIDVTGRSGDVYRRVVYKLPISSQTNSGLNDALFSEAGLCQNYSIIGGAKTPAGACP